MVAIRYAGADYPLGAAESVLDVLLSAGIDLPRGCRKGVCHSCMVQILSGNAPADAQAGIKPTLRAQGYVLACQCRPTADVEIAAADEAALFQRARVAGKERLSERVYRIYLETSEPFDYRPGQFINLRRGDGLMRSYSLASLPQSDAYLELHVGRMHGGCMSGWICDELADDDTIEIRGPNGDCFYVDGDPERPMLLIGTGTGLSPLLGIVRDAIDSGHSGDIHLFHGSRSEDGLYLTDALRGLDRSIEHFHFHPCLSGEEKQGFEFGRADDRAFAEFAALDNFDLYICGFPEMVRSAKKRAYLAGAALAAINADPFEWAVD